MDGFTYAMHTFYLCHGGNYSWPWMFLLKSMDVLNRGQKKVTIHKDRNCELGKLRNKTPLALSFLLTDAGRRDDEVRYFTFPRHSGYPSWGSRREQVHGLVQESVLAHRSLSVPSSSHTFISGFSKQFYEWKLRRLKPQSVRRILVSLTRSFVHRFPSIPIDFQFTRMKQTKNPESRKVRTPLLVKSIFVNFF